MRPSARAQLRTPDDGLDTNVMVRYLVQDDPDQSAAASALMDELTETDPGYLQPGHCRRAVLGSAPRLPGGCRPVPSWWKAFWTQKNCASTTTRSYGRHSPPTALALTSRMRSSPSSAEPLAATTRLPSTAGSARRRHAPPVTPLPARLVTGAAPRAAGATRPGGGTRGRVAWRSRGRHAAGSWSRARA